MPRRPKVESERIPTHFPDVLRMGVLAEEEGYELRLEAHFMHCEICREPALRLLRDLGAGRQLDVLKATVPCARARNAVFRYFEQGRELTQEEIDHLKSCEGCNDHFVEPARSARVDEVEDDIPSLG